MSLSATSKNTNVDSLLRSAHDRRVLRKAADLLEREADALKECSTLDGDWGDEECARQDYEEMKRVAHDLRVLSGNETKKEGE